MAIEPSWYKDLETDSTEDYNYDDGDDFYPFYDEEIEREEERRAFESIPKHGIHAHAYNRGLDNLKMRRLRKKGCTYRDIANQLNCSPSTVRNRLQKLGED